MADSSVLLEVVVEGKNIKVVQRQVEELAGAINRTSDSNTKNTRSTEENTKAKNKNTRAGHDLYRNQQGLAQNTSSGTKAFSKQARGLTGGLVPAYAALAANIFALTALFGALQRAAAVEQLEQGLIATGAAAGKNLPRVAESLKEITGFAISTKEALEATAIATSAGFSTSQLERLAGVARGAATALGRDLPDALNRLVRGTAKLEPEILDELGIMVRLDDAATEYAKSLGKTATELTRFERQQAFLNETLTQGEKKFGDITKNIDPNPYNQLSAAFQDLSKVLFKVVNTVITPFVEFLNQNSFALTGALLIFGSTVVNQVATPLREAAQEAANLSTVAAKKAKQAATNIKTAFGEQLKVVNNSIKTIPKSMEAIVPAFKNGTVSVKEMRAAVATLSNSERQRNIRLKNYTGEQLAQKQAELAEVVALRLEIEKLIATERERGVTSFKGIDIGNLSNSQKSLSRYLTLMADAGPIEGFQIAMRGASRQFRIFNATMGRGSRSLGFFGKALLFIKGGFRAATASARLFGAALLNALPIIGQIIFFGGLLYDALSWLWEDTPIQKASKDIVKSFEDIEKSASKLAGIQANPDLKASEKYNAELNVTIGLVDQLTAGLVKLQQTQQEQSNTEIADAVKVYNTRKSFRDKAFKQYKNAGYKEAEINRMIAGLNYDLARAEQAVSKARENSRKEIDKTNFNNVIDGFIGQIETSEELKAAFGGTLQGLKDLKTEANSPGFTGGYKELIKAAENLVKPQRQLLASQEALTSGFGELTKESIKFSKGSETKFDPLISIISGLANEAKKLEEAKVSLIPEAERERAETLKTAYSKIFEGLEGDTTADVLRNASKEMTKQVSIMETSKEIAAEQNALAKKYSAFAKTNSVFAEMQVKAERAALDAKIAGKKAEQKLTRVAIAEEIAAQEKILNDSNSTSAQRQEAQLKLNRIKTQERALGFEIAGLEASRVDSAEEVFRLSEAKIAQEKIALDINNKILAAQDKQREITAQTLRNTLELSRVKTGSDSTAEDDYNLTLAANTAKINAEDARLQLQLKGIDLEYRLLEAKQAFEKARLQGLRDEEGASAEQVNAANEALRINQEVTNLIATARTETESAAKAQSAFTKAQLQNEISITKEKKLRRDVELSLESSRASLERLKTISDSNLLGAIEYNQLITERKILENDLAALLRNKEAGEQNSQAILEKQLQIRAKETEELAAQLKLQEYLSKAGREFQLNAISGLKEQVSLRAEIANLANTDPITGKPKDLNKYFEIAEQERAERLKLAQVESALKKAMINSEFNLLKAKAKMLEAELKKDGLTPEEQAVIDANNDILSQQSILNDITKENIDLEFKLLKEKTKFEREKMLAEIAREKAQETPLGGLLAVTAGMAAAYQKISKQKEESAVEKKLREVGAAGDMSTEGLLKAQLDETIKTPSKIGSAVAKATIEGAKLVGEKVSEVVGQVIQNMTVQTMTVQSMVSSAAAALPSSQQDPAAAALETSTSSAPAMAETSAVKQNIIEPPKASDFAEEMTPNISMPELPKPDYTFTEFLGQARAMAVGFAEDLKHLGPEGEAMSAFISGGLALADSITSTIENFGQAETASQKAQVIMSGVSSAIGAIGQMQAAASQQRIAALDKEIAAEKARDGKSKESLAKIAALEKKKEQEKRKAFEQDKKMKMAQTVINTAGAIMNALMSAPFPANLALAALAGAMGAAQLAMISSQTYSGGSSGTPSTGAPTAINLGERKTTVDLAKSQSASGELAYMRGQMGTGGPENFTPAFMGAKYRATGGPTAGYVVGEQGPELFVPSTPGTIVPESKVAPTNPTNVNFTITALDASGVEDILVRQRGNIIGMMREAANSYGQPFLEGVDIASYTQEAGGVTRY